MRAFAHVGQKNLPNAAPEQAPQRVDASIPAIEIADHADALRVRRPEREVNALHARDRLKMGAKFFVKIEMVPFGKEMQIDLTHDRAVAVGVVRD